MCPNRKNQQINWPSVQLVGIKGYLFSGKKTLISNVNFGVLKKWWANGTMKKTFERAACEKN